VAWLYDIAAFHDALSTSLYCIFGLHNSVCFGKRIVAAAAVGSTITGRVSFKSTVTVDQRLT
jgi:hypothetical protein